jgi:hypothetical protein
MVKQFTILILDLMKDLFVGNINALKSIAASFTDYKLVSITLIFSILNYIGYVNFNELLWLAVLVGLDFLTGVIKAYIRDGYGSITSKKMRDTVFKVTQYGAFLIAMHVLVNKFEHFSSGVDAGDFILYYSHIFLLLIEVKSIFENISAVNSNFMFLRQLNSLLESPLQKIKRVIVVESVKLNIEKETTKEEIEKMMVEKKRIDEHLAAYEEKLSKNNVLVTGKEDGTYELKNIDTPEKD